MKKHKRIEYPMKYYVDMTDTHVRAEHVKWLQTNIGGYHTLWDYGGVNRINFLREQDRLLFVLRWA
jgi:hypothetical protein